MEPDLVEHSAIAINVIVWLKAPKEPKGKP
jgi:hypothetical protein